MHPKLAQAIQEIDAAVMNGDSFWDPDDRAEFVFYLNSWVSEIPKIERMAKNRENDCATDDEDEP